MPPLLQVNHLTIALLFAPLLSMIFCLIMLQWWLARLTEKTNL